MVGRFSPRPPPSSAAQYALSSITTPILDGHPAGRSFGVAGRAPLVSLPPRVNFIPPIGGLGPIGYAGGFSGSGFGTSGLGSGYSPNDLGAINSANSDASGMASSESEDADEASEELKKLLEHQEEIDRIANDKKKELQEELEQADSKEKTEKIEKELNEIQEQQDKYKESVDKALDKVKETINSNLPEGQDELSRDEIKAKIKDGSIKEIIDSLDPEIKAQLGIELGSLTKTSAESLKAYSQALLDLGKSEFTEEQRNFLNQSKTLADSLSTAAPSQTRKTSDLDEDSIFS